MSDEITYPFPNFSGCTVVYVCLGEMGHDWLRQLFGAELLSNLGWFTISKISWLKENSAINYVFRKCFNLLWRGHFFVLDQWGGNLVSTTALSLSRLLLVLNYNAESCQFDGYLEWERDINKSLIYHILWCGSRCSPVSTYDTPGILGARGVDVFLEIPAVWPCWLERVWLPWPWVESWPWIASSHDCIT